MSTKMHKQQGFALLSALVIVLIIASLCTAWISQSHHHLKIQTISHENRTASMIAESAHIWASQVLRQRRFRSSSSIIATTDESQLQLKNGWKIQASIIDGQSLFNINSITEESLRMSFFLLLRELLEQDKSIHLKTLFQATVSWINQKSYPNQVHTFNDIYRTSPIPYQAANQMMANISEWLLVAGMNDKAYHRLKPYFTALPESTPLNINTCPKILIKVLKPNLKDADVEKIVYARGKTGFRSRNELFSILQSFKIPVQSTTIWSQYFFLEYTIIAPSLRQFHAKILFYRPLRSQNQQTSVIKLQTLSD